MPLIGFYSSDCDSIQTMEAPGCPQKDPGFDQTGCSTWPGHDFSTTTPMTVSDGLRGGADTNCGYASYKFAGMDAVHQQLIDNATIDQAAHRTLRAIFQASACSRPPPPMTRTFMGVSDSMTKVPHAPVNTIAMPCSSAAAITSASRRDPPGCATAVAPASAMAAAAWS